jgi:hypothetical protein
MNSTLIQKLEASGAPDSRRMHIMSVDVEDYFMVEAFAGSVSRKTWDSRPSRLLTNTMRVLDLFDKFNDPSESLVGVEAIPALETTRVLHD